jgi:winged helix DNA-binding protein
MTAATGRTITQRELNRALLARQQLLERSTAGIPAVLERMGGLQAQYAPSMYVGLWTRMQGFERDQLTRALERRSVVQGTLMRVTIHLVSKRDYWPFAIGFRRGRREQWLRARQRQGVSDRELAAAAKRLRKRLRDGPMNRKELDRFLGKGSVWTNGVNMWLDLLRIPPSGTWEHRRADLYAAAEEWIGPGKVTPDRGIEHLLRRYLGGFGPSTRAEIADWAGLRPKQIVPTLERLQLRRFVAEDGEELLDLPRAPLPDPDTRAPVRFLPVWDATMLAHSRRTGILPEQHRPKIFNTKTPQSAATFLVDGAVAGTWSQDKGRIKIQPFGRLDAATRRELDEEADRLAHLYA